MSRDHCNAQTGSVISRGGAAAGIEEPADVAVLRDFACTHTEHDHVA
jgi:hypothetical protein